jgi:hypothetical protein
VETAFPFTTFEVEEYFALTVEIAPPLAMFRIFEMLPSVIMHFLKPL